MLARTRLALVACVLLSSTGALAAQTVVAPPQPQPIPVPKADPPPGRDVVAARVNGQVLAELAVYRGLMRVQPGRRDEHRKDVLNYLIDNMIVDQYLLQLKLPVDAKEVEEHINKLRKEAQDEKPPKDFTAELKKLHITEDELRTELTFALRWDKFVLQQAPEKVLLDYFKSNPDMFNGSRVRARHILIPIADGKPEVAQAKLVGLKNKIEQESAQAVAKLPATTDPLTREKQRAKALEEAFAKAAFENSTCPSAKDGGDLKDPFHRVGEMVEPFARAAFALKPYQMSDPVLTEHGYHLILAVEHEVGKDVPFDKVKPFVQEVYGERLREAVLAAYKGKAKIEIMPRAK